MLKQEIEKLGYEILLEDKDFGFTIVVTIPKWEIEETTIVSEDEDNWYIAPGDQPGEEEFFIKEEWTFEQAIRNFFKPVDESPGVKRNFSEVYGLLQNLKEVNGADELLEALSNVMSTEAMAETLEKVAFNWDIAVNEDGTIYNI